MRLLNIPKKPLLESSLALACELLLAGGEMVWYNITAYNKIINFTVSKREVYNSKLRFHLMRITSALMAVRLL